MTVYPAKLEYAVDAVITAFSEHIKRRRAISRAGKAQKNQVDRLLDLRHRSRLDHIEAVLAKLHKRLVVHIEDVPRAAA
jgi:hypothetical protein